MQLNVFNDYSYTIEMIIQAGQKNLIVKSVPVRTNPALRRSRLVKSIGSYVVQMFVITTRIFIIYRALRFFFIVGLLVMLPGVVLGLRYIWIMASGGGLGNIQSLIFAAVFLLAGFFVILSGFLADLISVNRKLLEEVRARTINLEYHVLGEAPSPAKKKTSLVDESSIMARKIVRPRSTQN
jgi:hypothetical protein